MINAIIKNTQIEVFSDERIVSSSEGIYKINFNFSDEWNEYTEKYIVFKINNYREEKRILGNNICEIPLNIMKEFGGLQIGVYAYNLNAQKSTSWSNKIMIEKSSLTDEVYYEKEDL